jgi:hypothetical protein
MGTKTPKGLAPVNMSEAAHLTNDLFDADDVQDMAPMVVLEYEPTAADASQHPEQSTSSKVTDSTILGMDHATNDSLDVEDKSSTTIGEYKPPEVGTTQQPEQFLTSKKTDSIAAPQSNYTADSPDEIADILSTLGIQHKSPAVDAIHQPKQFVTSKTTDNIIMPEVDHIKDSLDDIADTVPTTDVEPQSTAVNASEQPEQLITTKTTGNIINAEVYDTTDSLPDATDTSSTMIQPELPAVNATQQSNHLANPQSMGTACNPEANDTEQASLHVKHITSSTEIEHKPLEVWHMRQQPEPLMHIGDLSGAQRSQLSQGPLAKFFIGDDLFETIPRDLWLAATTPFHAGPGLCTCMKIEMNSKAEIHFPEDTDRAALRYITDWLKSTLTDGDDPARRTPIAKGFPEPHRIAVNVYRLALRLGIIRYFGYMCKYLSLHMHHCWKLYPLSLSPSMMAFIEDGAANSLDWFVRCVADEIAQQVTRAK